MPGITQTPCPRCIGHAIIQARDALCRTGLQGVARGRTILAAACGGKLARLAVGAERVFLGPQPHGPRPTNAVTDRILPSQSPSRRPNNTLPTHGLSCFILERVFGTLLTRPRPGGVFESTHSTRSAGLAVAVGCKARITRAVYQCRAGFRGVCVCGADVTSVVVMVFRVVVFVCARDTSSASVLIAMITCSTKALCDGNTGNGRDVERVQAFVTRLLTELVRVLTRLTGIAYWCRDAVVTSVAFHTLTACVICDWGRVLAASTARGTLHFVFKRARSTRLAHIIPRRVFELPRRARPARTRAVGLEARVAQAVAEKRRVGERIGVCMAVMALRRRRAVGVLSRQTRDAGSIAWYCLKKSTRTLCARPAVRARVPGFALAIDDISASGEVVVAEVRTIETDCAVPMWVIGPLSTTCTF